MILYIQFIDNPLLRYSVSELDPFYYYKATHRISSFLSFFVNMTIIILHSLFLIFYWKVRYIIYRGDREDLLPSGSLPKWLP